MTNHPNRNKPRLTPKEWRAVGLALDFALAGEDPWEDEPGMVEAAERAQHKLPAVLAARDRNRFAPDREQELREEISDLDEEVQTLRACLRTVTDMLATLLDNGKFPVVGRTQDEQEYHQCWWEDHVSATQRAYAALAREHVISWVDAHPGLHIPPPGPIKL